MKRSYRTLISIRIMPL